MPALPENILTSLTNIAHAPKLESCFLQPLDMAPNGEKAPWQDNAGGPSAVRFQYWPESLQDVRASEWNPRNIPGGSHPIYQWTHGGERNISFTAIFTTDTDPGHHNLLNEDAYRDARTEPLNGLDIGDRDVDLRAVVSWLRWYTYPAYEDDGSKVYEPAKCLLVMPNTKLGHSGLDHVTCVMTQCDVTYQAWFVNGFPRVIEVSLSFAEVVQSGRRVAFHDRRHMRQAGFARTYLSATDTTVG